jgi:hypothetical protein
MSVSKLVYMVVGLVLALLVYGIVSGSTGNAWIGIIGFVAVLAFWTGALKMVFNVGGD